MPVPDSETDDLISAPISDVAGALSGETFVVGTGATEDSGDNGVADSGTETGVGSDETGICATGSVGRSVLRIFSGADVFSVCCE